jgi:hypothetical protein
MEIKKIDFKGPGIAVIANAWSELNKDIHLTCFHETLKLIDSIKEISTVLLAATHVDLNQENQGINAWYDNAKRIFVDEQGVSWVRRYWSVPRDPGFATHSPLIRDHDYGGKLCLAIWEQWELEYLLNHCFTQEQNIWYFGSGLGVRRDPFGWAQLCDLIRHRHVRPMNILTHRYGITDNFGTGFDSESNFSWVDWKNNNRSSVGITGSDWCNIEEDIFLKINLEW